MDSAFVPAFRTAAFWLLFGGSHVLLASHPLRSRLVARLGRNGFLLLFYAVASLTFSLLVHDFASHRLEGAAGPGLGAGPLGAFLGGVNAFGLALVFAALLDYPRSAYAFDNVGASRPRGIETVTRHGFFVGLALLGASHVLLAPRLVGAVFMGSMAVFVLVGAAHQDRKLLRERGEPYRAYLAATSMFPFAAVLSGRTPLRARELPYLGLAAGVAAAFWLRGSHANLFADGGLWAILVVVGGAINFAIVDALRERRRALRARESVAS